MSINMDWMKGLGTAALAFGRKNKTSIMMGGGLGCSWLALILMMIEAPKAAKKIEDENRQRKEDDLDPMSRTEVVIEYGKNCWPAVVAEAAGTALEIAAHKELLDSVSELMLLSQLYKDQGDKLKRQILKEDGGEKKLKEYYDRDYEDRTPAEEIIECPEYQNLEPGKTMIDDETTGQKFNQTMTGLRDGFANFNQVMNDRYLAEYKKKYGEKMRDAFFSSSDNPYPVEDENIYVTGYLDEFLTCIGEKKPHDKMSGLGKRAVFYYRGKGPCVDFNKVVDCRNFTDPESGKVIYARLCDLFDLGILYIDEDAIFNDDDVYGDWSPSGKRR